MAAGFTLGTADGATLGGESGGTLGTFNGPTRTFVGRPDDVSTRIADFAGTGVTITDVTATVHGARTITTVVTFETP